MGSLVVQITGKNQRAQDYARSIGPTLKIGRSFANDLVLTDPYVAPEQIRCEKHHDRWLLSILDRTNPVLLNGTPVLDDTVAVRSGDRLMVGRTELAIFSDDHSVDATRKLAARWLTPERIGPWRACAVLLGVALFDVVAEFLQSSVDLEWKDYLYGGLFSAAVIVAWAGAWAIAGRVLRHHSQFFAQLLMVSLVSLGCSVVFPIVDYLGFWTSSVTITRAAYYVVGVAALTVLLKWNLVLATNVRNTGIAAFFVSASVIGLGFAASQYTADEFEPEPDYAGVVKPPFAHLSSDRSIEAFMADTRRDAARL